MRSASAAWLRESLLALIVIVAVGSALIIVRDDVLYRVDLHSVLEIWGDVVRDAETIPLTVTRMSVRQEVEIGRELHRAMARDALPRSSQEHRYAAALTRALAAHAHRRTIEYQIAVLDSDEINAFALPGGFIYVTKGMLEFAEDEAELASVIGHEISHVSLRHCIERLQYQLRLEGVVGKELALATGLVRRLVTLGYTEQQETEADIGGLQIAAAAGYEPAAALRLHARFAARHPAATGARSSTLSGEIVTAMNRATEEYFRTHPYGAVRVNDLVQSFRKNTPAWEGQRFYRGRNNLRVWVARTEREFSGEWVDFEETVDVDSLVSSFRLAGESSYPVDLAASTSWKPVKQWNKVTTAIPLLNVQESHADTVATLVAGERVFIESRQPGTSWALARARGKSGYLNTRYLARPVEVRRPRSATTSKRARDRAKGGWLRVSQWNRVAESASLRSQPSFYDGEELTRLEPGESVFVEARLGGTRWVRVRAHMHTGYLHVSELKRTVHDGW